MKHLLFTLCLSFGICVVVQAQSVVSLQPIPAMAFGTADDVDVATDAEITNITSNTIHMKWERQVIILTPGCETAVCDPNTCWARSVSTKPFDMDANEVGQMLVHFYPNGADCAGIIHVKVTNLDNPNDITTGIYMYNQNTGTKDLPAANVKLYPNPVVDFFTLQNAADVAFIRVFTLDGREVATFDAAAGDFYSLQNQPAGNYVVALQDKNGEIFQALELNKQ